MKNASLKYVLLTVTVLALGVWAAAVTLPNTFSEGEVLSADKMNENFKALEDAVTALETKVATLEAQKALPSVAGQLGYAWADQSSAASYTPSSTYSYNSSGGAITATRSGTGVYQITFGGLEGDIGQGNVQVTAYGSSSIHCKVTGWGSSGGNWSAAIRCYDSAGALADSQYNVLVTW